MLLVVDFDAVEDRLRNNDICFVLDILDILGERGLHELLVFMDDIVDVASKRDLLEDSPGQQDIAIAVEVDRLVEILVDLLLTQQEPSFQHQHIAGLYSLSVLHPFAMADVVLGSIEGLPLGQSLEAFLEKLKVDGLGRIKVVVFDVVSTVLLIFDGNGFHEVSFLED